MISKYLILSVMLLSMNANAGIPVIDATSVAQQIQQVIAWGKQYVQMKEEYQQLEKTYKSMNGVRGMANLVNDPALRKYLPDNYQEILSNGYGNSAAIREAEKLIGIEETLLNPNSDVAEAFELNATQVAVNQALAEAGYEQSFKAF